MPAFCIQLSTQGNNIPLALRALFALELRHEIRRRSMCTFDHDCLLYIQSLLQCDLTFHSFLKNLIKRSASAAARSAVRCKPMLEALASSCLRHTIAYETP